MKAKYIFNVICALCIVFGFIACSDDEVDRNISVIVDSQTPQNDLDRWLEKNFVQRYNIEMRYRWEDNEIDMNYILVLRPGVDPNFVKESIYTNTRLQNTFRLYLKVFVDDGMYVSTKRMNYTEYLTHFIDIRRITKQRYYCHKHQKLQTRLHVVNNYIWAFESKKVTDEVLGLIRKKN